MDRLRNMVLSSRNFPACYTSGDVYFSPRGLIFLGYTMVSVSSWVMTFFFLSWWKIDLQCSVGFCCITVRIRHNYVYVASFLSLPLVCQYWFSRFHIYALIDDTCLFLTYFPLYKRLWFICVTITDSDLFLFYG